ncbi:LA_3751/LA_3752 family putative glycosyltransferase [Leptospira sp. GIMC2001]|uniref:LA_3751/LA_3752 family putative glycosyltransferase n=1 Tax=Leptospira sp. GIMC2001 TaxID=1513297 RepID=UPI0023497081|nr:hypothetical protein [Leptospira sp. GIMC2001]WCL48345.1 hypothetical protein O4O04_13650 [Leptospira sp. GIMC2001]
MINSLKLLRNSIKINYHFFLIFIFLVFILVYRSGLDKDALFITSDGQIKYFQTVQLINTNILNSECFYNGKSLDPEFNFFPIRYPWSLIGDSIPNRCVFEYPPFFPYLATAIYYIFGFNALIYIPLFFLILSGFVFFKILNFYDKEVIFKILLFISAFFSLPLLTAMDFSESPIYHFLGLCGIYFFVKPYDSIKKNLFLLGFLFGLSIYFRLESLIPIFFCGLYLVLFSKGFQNKFSYGLYLTLGFCIPFSIFCIFNYLESGHPLGFRFISSLLDNEVSSPDFSFRMQLWKAYLFGDIIMVGLFSFQPLSMIAIITSLAFAVTQRLNFKEGLLIFSGILSLIFIPLSVKFYGGVGYFGLRYLETPMFFLYIGIGLSLLRNSENFSKVQIYSGIAVILISFYFNYKATNEGLKVLKNGARDYQILQNFFKLENQAIIHTSLYSSIFIGKSFIKDNHFHIHQEKVLNEFLNSHYKNKKVILVLPPDNMYVSADIPKKFHENYKTDININKINITILEQKSINSITLIHGLVK